MKTIAAGGTGDLFIFFARSPDNVVDQFHGVVGEPLLVPEWALGWHQSKVGYKNTSSLQENVQKYNDSNLPLDAQWVDMDYMHEYKDFTIDPTRFAGLTDFV